MAFNYRGFVPSDINPYPPSQNENIERKQTFFESTSQFLGSIVDSLADSESKSASGISFKSQFLYLTVYITRYLDLFWTFYEPKSLYNTVFKIIFIASSSYVVYLMLNDYKPTHDPNLDTFKVQYLLGFAAVMAVLFPYRYTPTEVKITNVTVQ